MTSRSPAWVFCQPSKRTYADDLVDVVDDALDDDRRVLVPRLLEELGERGLAELLVAIGCGRALGSDDVAREVEQLLQELDADEQPLLVSLLEVLEPLAELLEPRVVRALAQPARRP